MQWLSAVGRLQRFFKLINKQIRGLFASIVQILHFTDLTQRAYRQTAESNSIIC